MVLLSGCRSRSEVWKRPRPVRPTRPFLFCFPNTALSSAVKTRTKDKYRVVYTDHQRLELEKEFHYSRYITIRRKAELASSLGLSERQVKIWFQNRRAKERKINKKKLQQAQPGAAEPLSPAAPGRNRGHEIAWAMGFAALALNEAQANVSQWKWAGSEVPSFPESPDPRGQGQGTSGDTSGGVAELFP
ncbi:homeobox protein CDX-2 [Meleagris gallopavo]|uniref:homeobox protein CDX-2 n=1 Tax=Meleagris gallopavo TaxID=9103 RepID=UPI0012AB93DA|nr:homeobox protein CDX-2 [Meleagris gallopavo]